MAAIYKEVYPHKMKTSQTLIANFKERKNIKYDGQIRPKTDYIRGCYISVKVKHKPIFIMTHLFQMMNQTINNYIMMQ